MPNQEQTSLSRTPVRARDDSGRPAAFTLLVPLNGNELADDIRPYVASLADAKAARIILLHVLPDLTRESADVITRSVENAQDHLIQFKEKLGTKSDADVLYELRMGNAASEIIKLSILASANMIAMPTHGRSGLKRLITGSVTEAVLRQSRCPMLLLHSSGQGAAGKMRLLRPFSRILVAIEGTPYGDQILPIVEDLASTFRVELFLFHNDPGVDDTGKRLEPQSADKVLSEIQSKLKKSGLKASVVETHAGKTPNEIMREAEKLKIDLIAMTTHGRRGLDRVTYGSITEEVLRHCARPLLVQCVPPARRPESDNEPSG